ncbi:MAG TPA: biotin carboxylase N-terminal domain-containing protein [Nocardioides sp.]|uniref:acetyl/propionyl/methylcrotonyl-CoA carboxylase subunit alpha n=1 Tax=Nocardioides sp. TaxID=35761 RepID=UPI002D80DB03|nr:biotin carboxylase N-terminal domain-containing protein [Nocardioides sp.]HET6652742.1 biotin carboxylase N-terminal domain-containing protein [Nocardioides sp.]
MFESVLVANRGEIALRVIRTCRRLGVRSVAVFTDLDASAPHVREADDAVRVPSYLDVDAVVQAALDTGAEAVHPGYGFLSERSPFARALEKAGVVLVGPSADVMDAMGRKDAAREIAVGAGVPVVPRGEDAGFPILVKAAAGGGGKGMRIVRSAGEHDEAVAAARREALSAFGDDTILVEKYVERGRHIEVQVLADTHGSVLHLFERDCSTQRRHQKVLEEAPAPTIDAGQREAITSAAVALARQVGYTNAGTVEFLLDESSGEFYFLEMNTRLQVEHPVTELVALVAGRSLDLVEHQLRVAAGEPLSFTQDDVVLTGHAIEARIYAEDSFGGFLPQAGRAEIVRWSPHARNDHALEDGQVISTSYDPMLGKVIVHGETREAARQALVRALDETAVLGLTTNTGFLRALVASDEFRDATIHTAWLDHEGAGRIEAPTDDVPRTLAAWVDGAVLTGGDPHPFQLDGWRHGGTPAPVVVDLDRAVTVVRDGAGRGTVDGVPVAQVSAAYHKVVAFVDGRREEAVVNSGAHGVEVVHRGQRFVFTRPDPFADPAAAAGDGTLLAPMPGTVLDVRVAEGQQVAEGDVLGVMEAMKMELSLKAPVAGTVTVVGAAAGDQVALGATLFVVTADLSEPETAPTGSPSDNSAAGGPHA